MRIDRYELFGSFATGGMASVHFGKLFASAGFQRVVAIKVPHVQFVSDADFRAMFLDEARIVARIRSPHVVATLDIIEAGSTLYQVMEYANGPALSAVIKATRTCGEQIPLPLVISILADTLEGLHTAHEVKDDTGTPLDVVHRDVSPQNILVTDDGIAKVIDFGIASAAGRLHLTQPGNVKGKVSYMAPEQVDGRPLDRRADIYAVGVVLYETLTGQRPFTGEDFSSTALMHVMNPAPDPRVLRPDISPELAAIVARALEKKPKDRFPTARAMADALLALPIKRAAPREVGEWLGEAVREFFVQRSSLVAALPSVEDVTTLDTKIADDGGRKSQLPTRLDLAPPRSKDAVSAASGDETIARPRRWPVAMIPLIVVCVAAGFFILENRPSRAKPNDPAMASASSSAATPILAATAVAPPAESTALAVSSSTSSPPATRTRPTAKTPAAAKPAPTASASSAPVVAQSPCCAGDLRIRFTDCSDNCPAGATGR
jgi:eukaryotic-like serine/threonine-protein kinase